MLRRRLYPPRSGWGPMRPLDGWEQRAYAFSRVCPSHIVALVRLRGEVSREFVRAGLDRALEAHPLATMRIVGEGAEACWVRHPAGHVPVREAAWAGSASGHAELEREVDAPFQPGGPLLRVTALPGSEESALVLAADHILGDGLGVYSLAADVVRCLVAFREGTKPDIGPAALGPSMEQLLPPPPPGGLPAPAPPDLTGAWPLPADGDAPAADRRTRVRTLTLPAPALTHAARARGTTVQGVLAAALMQSILATAPPPAGEAPVLCSAPVNARPFLTRPVGPSLGIFPWRLATHHRVGRISFWDLAREVRDRMRPSLEPSVVAAQMAALRRAPVPTEDQVRALVATFDRPPFVVTGVSNLGQLPPPGIEDWRGFQMAIPVIGGPSVGMFASTFRDELTLSFLVPEPFVGPARAAAVVEGVGQRLRAAAS